MIPRVLFGSWELWSLLTGGALVVVFLKSRRDFLLLASICITLIAVYATSLLTSGIEHPRHSVTSAVALRLLAIVALVYALPRATRNRELDELADEHE
jgi:membrane protein YdbS with pleckstrin-like domain